MIFRKENKINSTEQPKIFFWSIVVLIFIGLFSYGYLVRASIVNIVERQSSEKELIDLSSRVLNLESEYIKVKNTVTLDTARDLGFTSAASQKFVTKSKNSSASLSVNLR